MIRMKNSIYYLLFLYLLVAILTIVFFNGTGDAGDSIMHYLFAKYAPLHPGLFFDHFAKPFFVLITSPFAQFGFTGIKIFNAITTFITIYLTYIIAVELNMKNAIVAAIIIMFAPLYYILTFSGLTEPLFALFIAASLLLSIKEKQTAACLLVSFLPFVRSEGLIIIGVFAIYFLYKKRWSLVPLLLFGSLVYSIAGYFVHHDFLWVFTKIPYAKLSSNYGSGKLLHFAEQLIYVVGVPVYFLFWTGVISLVIKSIGRKIGPEVIILILLGFACFFIAHSLFWYLGIFNSMGLKRVLIGVMPLMGIISLYGFNFLSEEIFVGRRFPKLIIRLFLVVYIILFPFTSNPAALKWERDMMLSKGQKLAGQMTDFPGKQIAVTYPVLFADPYLAEVLSIDWFDPEKRIELNRQNIAQMKAGNLILWENWFAVVEQNVTKMDLDTNASLLNLYTASVDDQGREIIYAIYMKK